MRWKDLFPTDKVTRCSADHLKSIQVQWSFEGRFPRTTSLTGEISAPLPHASSDSLILFLSHLPSSPHLLTLVGVGSTDNSTAEKILPKNFPSRLTTCCWFSHSSPRTLLASLLFSPFLSSAQLDLRNYLIFPFPFSS